MSTASCAPWWMGSPDANTSIACSSSARTSTFMSLNLEFKRTNAPASRHTLARVLSVGTALVRNLPDRGHGARCLPKAGGVSRTPICGMPLVPSCWATEEDSTGPWAGVRPKVSLVGGTRLGKDHGLPEEVFRGGRRVELPAVLPFTELGTVCQARAFAPTELRPRNLAASCN